MSAAAKSRQHGRSPDRSQDLRYRFPESHTLDLTPSRCGKKRRVTSGHPKIGGLMSQERLDTVLRWITLLWVIATLVLITATWMSVPQLLKSA